MEQNIQNRRENIERFKLAYRKGHELICTCDDCNLIDIYGNMFRLTERVDQLNGENKIFREMYDKEVEENKILREKIQSKC